MNTNPTITFSPETIGELASIICSLYPTMGDFNSLLDSAKRQVSTKETQTTRNRISTLINPRTEPSYKLFSDWAIRTSQKSIASELQQFSNKPELMRALIRIVFKPQKFVNQINDLKEKIERFNACSSFDGWCIQIQEDGSIEFFSTVLDMSPFLKSNEPISNWAREIQTISWKGITNNQSLVETLNYRLRELQVCLEKDLPLSTIILSGGILEGVLQAIAESHPKAFNTATSCPKEDGKPLVFRKWSLASLINVATEIGFLNEGSKKFNQTLRDFRNFVHPLEQVTKNFNPDMATARLCFQTMKETILQIQQHCQNESSPPRAS